MEQAKQFDIKAKSFIANGTEYFILSADQTLTAHRFTEYEKLRFEYESGGLTWAEMEAQDKECETILNNLVAQKPQSKNVLDVIMIFKARKELAEKARKNESFKMQYTLMLSTLFINTAGEDVRKWDRETASKKISDWMEEGYHWSCFFLLIINFLEQLNEPLKKSTEVG